MISQSKNKQEEILAAALRLFADNGFHGTPTSKIAKEAGVANGTLFHYYSTKEDLIVALYIDIKRRMAAYIDDKAAKETTAKETFKNQYVEILKWSLDNRSEFQFLQQFSASPYALLLSPEIIKEQLQKTCHDIKEAIKQNAIKNRDVDFILTIFSSHTFGLNQYLIKNKLSKKKQDEVIKDSFEMLWTMLS